ncbi:MAG: hypothetical protein V3V69_00480 [Nitrosopumilaceae archaeon]
MVIFTFLLFIPPAFGQFFDTPGLVNRLQVENEGYIFEVHVVSSFDIPSHQFSSEEKRLSFFVSTSVSNNLSEIQIPKNLLNGNFTFYLNGQEIFADVKTNDKISLITIEFPGKGLHKLDIIGTTTTPTTTTTPLPESSEITPLVLVISLVLTISLIGIVFLKKFRKKITH